MFKAKSKQKDEQGQGLVEYALILVLVAVVVIVVLIILGPAIGNVFSGVLAIIQTGGGPVNGDICVEYFTESDGSPWHFIWEYQETDWVRIPEPGGELPTCSFSPEPDNGSR